MEIMDAKKIEALIGEYEKEGIEVGDLKQKLDEMKNGSSLRSSATDVTARAKLINKNVENSIEALIKGYENNGFDVKDLKHKLNNLNVDDYFATDGTIVESGNDNEFHSFGKFTDKEKKLIDEALKNKVKLLEDGDVRHFLEQ